MAESISCTITRLERIRAPVASRCWLSSPAGSPWHCRRARTGVAGRIETQPVLDSVSRTNHSLKSMLLKRPFGVTLLLWLVLMLIAWGGVRLSAALRGWDILVEFESALSPLYLCLTGAAWGVAGCVLLIGLFTTRSWTRWAILTSAVIWLLEYWIERVLYRSPRVDLPFALANSILILSITLICTLHKSTRDFFTGSEEYEQQNEDSGTE